MREISKSGLSYSQFSAQGMMCSLLAQCSVLSAQPRGRQWAMGVGRWALGGPGPKEPGGDTLEEDFPNIGGSKR